MIPAIFVATLLFLFVSYAHAGVVVNYIIDLTSQVIGTLPIANGGTGITTLGTKGQLLSVNSTASGLTYVAGPQKLKIVSQSDLGSTIAQTTSQTERTWRNGFFFPKRTRSVRLFYCNSGYSTSYVQTGSASTITLEKTYFEYAGTSYKVTYSGATNKSLTANSCVTSDPIDVDILDKSQAFARTYVTISSGSYITMHPANATDTYADTDSASATGALGSSSAGGYAFKPLAVLGRTDGENNTFVLIGDSLTAGTNDSYSGSYQHSPLGHLARGLGATTNPVPYAFLNAGVGSTHILHRLTTSTTQSFLTSMDWVDYAIISDGTNFLTTSDMIAAESYYIAYQKMLKSAGIKIYQTTIQPSGSTSTDGYQTTTNQTIDATKLARRTTLNTWIRCGAPYKVVWTGTGHISGTTLTIDSTTSGAVTTGGVIEGQETHKATYISSGSGTSWTVSISQTVGSSSVPKTMSLIAPQACGTAGSYVAGDGTHPLSGYIETANTVECNSSNVPTQNGGYWCANITTYDGGTASGGTNSKIIDASKSWTTNQHAGRIAYVSSGTGAGTEVVIWSNNATELTTAYHATATDATSVYTIIDPLTIDGTHGSPFSYPLMAAPISTLAASLN